MTTPQQPGPDSPADPAQPAAPATPATPTGPASNRPGSAARKRSVRIIWWLAAFVVILLLALFVYRISETPAGDTGAAEAALAKSADRLAGTGEPSALTRASCVSAGTDQYDCTPDGSPSEQKIRVVMLADGTAAIRLAGTTAETPLRSGAEVAAALTADAKARGLGNPSYACGTTLRMAPDGTMEAGGATGYLCAADSAAAANGTGDAPASPAATGARYVELDGDGLVTRDYVVKTQ